MKLNGLHLLLSCVALSGAVSCGGGAVDQERVQQALQDAQKKGATPGTDTGRALPLQALGPHRCTLILQIILGEDKDTRQVTHVTRVVDRGRKGAYSIRETRSWRLQPLAGTGIDDGREVIFNGKRFVSRRRWGPWKEREFWRGEHISTLVSAYDIMSMALNAFQRFVASQPSGTGKVLGKGVKWLDLSRNSTGKLVATEAEKRAWRFHEQHWVKWLGATHDLNDVDGKVAYLVDGGEVAGGKVTLSGTARVEDKVVPFRVVASMKVTPLPRGQSFVMPKKILPKGRTRIWHMVKDVLRDELNPMYKRSKPGTK